MNSACEDQYNPTQLIFNKQQNRIISLSFYPCSGMGTTAGQLILDGRNHITTDLCDDGWYGVICNATNNNVTMLQLYSNNLSGTIPPVRE